MPDARRHRGPHPQDAELFAPARLPVLRQGVDDYSWLLGRGYAAKSALALVGDRFQLPERARMAIMRASAGDADAEARRSRMVEPQVLAGAAVALDGFNVLTTIEVALSSGLLIIGRDGCLRDIASMHGTFRAVEETLPAAQLVGQVLTHSAVHAATWYFDAPVSNSGRLKTLLLELARENNWPWQVEIVMNPDPVLAASPDIVASADGIILDQCARWVNLARLIVEPEVADAWIVDLA
jgi:hypothetical protein